MVAYLDSVQWAKLLNLFGYWHPMFNVLLCTTKFLAGQG